MTTEKRVQSIMAVLARDWPEGTSTEDVALGILKAHDKTLDSLFRPIGEPLKVGMAFKHYLISKTHVVAWIGPDADGTELAWIVDESSNYGWIGRVDSPWWRWTTPVVDEGARRRVKRDGEWMQGEEDRKQLIHDIYMEITGELLETAHEGMTEEYVQNLLDLIDERSGASVSMDSKGYIWRHYPAPSVKMLTNDLGMKPGDKITMRQDGQYIVEAVAKESVLLRNRQSQWVWAEENSNLEKFYKDGWRD